MALRPLQETIDESLSNLRNPDGLSPFVETPDGQIMSYASEEEKEYRPLEEIEPKWWHLREQLRKQLINSGVPRYRVRELIGKNPEEFQRMTELRQEAGLEPMGMFEGMTQGLGTLDAALGITSLPAFTKTMGSMSLPYAAMGTEATTAFTDNLKAIKEEPENQPKDFGYYARRAGLPLAGAAGLMGFSRFVPKTDVPPTLPSQQTPKIDQTRRNILKTGAIGAGLASLPRPLTSTIKYGSKAPVVPAAAGKSFIEMMGPNLSRPNIRDKLSNSLEEFIVRDGPDYEEYLAQYERYPDKDAVRLARQEHLFDTEHFNKGFDESIPFLDEFDIKPGKNPASIKVLIDDDFNVTNTFKDLKKNAQKQAFGQETIHRHLADDANIIEIETIGHTGQKHFKNYGLKPDEVHIIAEYDFEGFVPQKDFTVGSGTQFEESFTKGISVSDSELQNIDDFERYYLSEHGRKINKEVDPGIPYEGGDMGFVGINYYEIDGVPIAVGRYTSADGGHFTDAIIIPNQKGIQRITGMIEEEVAKLLKVEKEGKFEVGYSGEPNWTVDD